MRKGAWYAVAAYTTWGFFPIYWKWLEAVPALQVVSHRIVWSCVVLIGLVLASRDWTGFRAAIQSPRTNAIYALAAVAVAINWFVYIWAVSAGFIVQTALGYFINPLVSVLMGVVILRETLRPRQWVAIALAAAGVLYLTAYYGTPPWIALALAGSFGTYGLLKKTAPLGPLRGLALETGILFVPALAWLLFEDHAGRGAFLHAGPLMTLLMIGAGPVTTLPLLLFAAAARRIPLSMMGMLQYINPTIQFLLGVFLYKEPFSRGQLAGFGLVWAALLVFGAESWAATRRGTSPVVV
jgi:chloramphenicol-sensitive protein RarD